MLSLRYTLLSVTLCLSFLYTFAQSTESYSTHFSVGLSAGLTYDWLATKSDDQLSDGVTATSKIQTGYLGKVTLGYSFNQHWKIKCAPELQKERLNYRIDGLHFSQDFNGSGFNDSHVIYDVSATNLSIPLTVEFVFGNKRIQPFISVGGAGEFILKQNLKGVIYYSNGTTSDLSGDFLRKTNIAITTSAGVYYNITEKTSLSVSPIFTHSFLNNSFNLHQNSLGITAGVFYNL